MKKVTNRIFRDGSVIGYNIMHEDGQVTQVTKEQLHLLAKNEIVYNVKALTNGGVSGINGFELKSLPSIILDNEAKREIKVLHEHILAFALRLVIANTQTARELSFLEMYSKIKREKLYSIDGFDISTDVSLGKQIKIVGVLINENGVYDKHKEGVAIQNIGHTTITISRLLYNDTHSSTFIKVNPGDIAYISKAELGFLAIDERVNFTFADGIHCGLSVKKSYAENELNMLNVLTRNYNLLRLVYLIGEDFRKQLVLPKIITEDVVPMSDINIYFRDSMKLHKDMNSAKANGNTTNKRKDWRNIMGFKL